jgi:TP901 family phage tail tape measure protein
MANASGIRAGQAFVELFADDRALVRGLRQAQQKIAAFGKSVRAIGAGFAALGAGIVAPLSLAAKSFADTGSKLNDMSARTGLSVEALSELSFAAQQSGSSLEDVEKSIRIMQRTVVAAANGSNTAAEALQDLGLSARDLAGQSPEAQFTAITDALRNIPDPTRQSAAAMAVFGRSGTALIPMIKDLAALRIEARAIGAVMTTKQATVADELGDAFDRIKASLHGVVNAVGAALAPTLTALAANVLRFVVGLGEWISRNEALVVVLSGAGVAILGVGGALIGLGIAASGLSAGLGVLATLVSAAGTAIAALATIMGALLTPIGAVIAGVVTLGAFLVTQSQTGQQALRMLGDGFRTLEDDAVTAWGGIADALAAGDIGAAAAIVWALLKLEWVRGTSFLLNLWDSAIAGFAQIFAHTWFGIQEVFFVVVNGIANAWDSVVASITKLWNNAVGFIASKLATLLELVGLADEGVDLLIEEETVQKNRSIDDERGRRSQGREKSVESMDDLRRGIVANIAQDLADKVQERDAGVEEARAALDAARAEARKARTASEQRILRPDAMAPTEVIIPDLDRLRSSIDSIPDTLMTETQKLDVSGSFAATAIGQIGIGGTAGERTAKATEDTARNTNRIAQALEDNEAVFG